MVDDGKPYMVAMNYGFRENTIYLHAALEGRKIDILRKNPDVCFMVHTGNRLTTGSDACGDWTMKYRSVTGFGKATLIEDDAVKSSLLCRSLWTSTLPKALLNSVPTRVAQTLVIRIDIEEMTGKISGYPNE